MKYIDFITQSVLLIGTLILAVVFGGSGILLGQFFIGAAQLLSSIISVITNAPFRKKKVVHLVMALVYLALVAVALNNKVGGGTPTGLILLMSPAWGLAIYYYTITWSWALTDNHRSKFLPNISF